MLTFRFFEGHSLARKLSLGAVVAIGFLASSAIATPGQADEGKAQITVLYDAFGKSSSMKKNLGFSAYMGRFAHYLAAIHGSQRQPNKYLCSLSAGGGFRSLLPNERVRQRHQMPVSI